MSTACDWTRCARRWRVTCRRRSIRGACSGVAPTCAADQGRTYMISPRSTSRKRGRRRQSFTGTRGDVRWVGHENPGVSARGGRDPGADAGVGPLRASLAVDQVPSPRAAAAPDSASAVRRPALHAPRAGGGRQRRSARARPRGRKVLTEVERRHFDPLSHRAPPFLSRAARLSHPVECASAIARLEREGHLSSPQVQQEIGRAHV